MELFEKQQALQKQLSASIKELEKYGLEAAQAEMNYKVSLHQNILKLREDGLPATLITVMVYGVRDVAEKRLKRDVAETMYNVCRERINGIKKTISTNDEQLRREWSNAS
jgi:DNA-binding ferritin-like protein (Dps family)